MGPIRSVWLDYREAATFFSRPARLFLLCEFLAYAAHGVHQVLYNLYLVEGGYLEAFVGRTISTHAAGLALFALPAGVLADRWGRRQALMLGATLEAVGLLLRSTWLDPSVIYAGSFVTGMGHALILITAAPFITEHSSTRERTHLFSTFFSMSLMAAVAGSMLGGALPWMLEALPVAFAPERIVGYRITLILGAMLSAAALVPLVRMGDLGETPSHGEPAPIDPVLRKRLVPIGVNAMLLGAGAGLVIPFMNLYFSQRFDCSSAQIGVFFAVAQVFTALAALMGPALARRFGKLRTATIMELMSLPFLVTLGAEQFLPIAVGAFWLRATLMQASTPLHQAFVMEALPRSLRASATSIGSLVWHAGWAVSATLAGVLIQRFGYAVPFYITAVLYFFAAAYFYMAFRRLPDQATEPVAPAEGSALGGEPPASE